MDQWGASSDGGVRRKLIRRILLLGPQQRKGRVAGFAAKGQEVEIHVRQNNE